MAQKMTRREFLKVSATSAAAAFLAGCAAPTPAAPAATEAAVAATAAPVEPAKAAATVDFLAWGDNADLPAWDKLSALYMERNPNVKVNVTAVADPNANFYTKLQTSIAGGTAPHVSSFQGWEWQTYADKDVLAPIDDLVARDGFGHIYPTDIKSVVDSTVRNGKKYLIPLQLATMLMMYSRKAFDDAGMDYPTDDWTWDEFIEIAQKITKIDTEPRMYGIQANGGWFRDIGWIRGTGKQEFDSIVDPKKAMFNQPEIVDIVQKIAYDFYYDMKIAPTPADSSGGANSFQTGNTAMKYEGPWFMVQMNGPKLREEKKNYPIDVVLMPKMADSERPHRGWAEGIALPKSSNIEEGWKFASFMASEEGDKIYSELTGRMPNDVKLIESFWLPTIEKNFEVKNGKAFIEAFKRSEVDVVGGVPRSKIWSEAVKPTGWDPLINGNKKAAEVLPEVDKAVQALLDEYWASV